MTILNRPTCPRCGSANRTSRVTVLNAHEDVFCCDPWHTTPQPQPKRKQELCVSCGGTRDTPQVMLNGSSDDMCWSLFHPVNHEPHPEPQGDSPKPINNVINDSLEAMLAKPPSDREKQDINKCSNCGEYLSTDHICRTSSDREELLREYAMDIAVELQMSFTKQEYNTLVAPGLRKVRDKWLRARREMEEK